MLIQMSEEAKRRKNTTALAQAKVKRVKKRMARPRQPGEVAEGMVAIKSFCLECFGGDVEGIRGCTDPECWLYPLRKGNLTRKEQQCEACVAKIAFAQEGDVFDVRYERESAPTTSLKRATTEKMRRREGGEWPTHRAAIRNHCLECHGWEVKETRN